MLNLHKTPFFFYPKTNSLENIHLCDEDADCPSGLGATWDVSDGAEGWVEAPSLDVTCQ